MSNKEILNLVASNIRRYRHARGLSQEELADLSGLHRTYIGMLERAEKNATLLSLEKVATALKISVATLLQKVEDK